MEKIKLKFILVFAFVPYTKKVISFQIEQLTDIKSWLILYFFTSRNRRKSVDLRAKNIPSLENISVFLFLF